ncbi:MAG: GTP-binding protein [Selenomonadaceae bacterium]|nr:GTP-binding protein [Selenomonadaceae bacterium]
MMFILADANRKVQETLDKIMRDLDSLSMTGKAAELKDKLTDIMAEREKVKVVLVGEYAAGKSSITKMLTGDESIGIAADITTDKATAYAWNGVEIIDTPGIKTGIREDHDNITKQAILEADMLIFVVTSELFDDMMAGSFRDMAFKQQRADAMILVVNKMNKTALGNVEEQQNILRDDLVKITSPDKKPEDFFVSFIDAEDYLTGQKETDEESKNYYLDISGEKNFIDNLNRFITEKSLIGKLCRPLHACMNTLEEIAEDNESIEGEDTDEIYTDKENLENARREIIAKINEYADSAESEIINIGNGVKDQLYMGANQQDINAYDENARGQVRQIVDEKIDMIDEEVANLSQLYDIDIKKEMLSVPIAKTNSHLDTQNLGVTDPFQAEAVKVGGQMAGLFGQAGENLAKAGANRAAITFGEVGKGMGFNGFFGPVQRFFNRGVIGQELVRQRGWGEAMQMAGKGMMGIAAVAPMLLGLYFTYKDEKEKKENQQRIDKCKADIANSYSDYAHKVKAAIKMLGIGIDGVLTAKIKEKNDALHADKALTDEKKINNGKIAEYQREINNLLAQINQVAAHG